VYGPDPWRSQQEAEWAIWGPGGRAAFEAQWAERFKPDLTAYGETQFHSGRIASSAGFVLLVDHWGAEAGVVAESQTEGTNTLAVGVSR